MLGTAESSRLHRKPGPLSASPSGGAPPGHGAMYNGIGLPTPRGSGTNGYVQRNLSLVRGRRGERPDYKGEEELRRLEAALVKRPNPDILDHERKRRVELRCLELEEMMEEQGYEEQQIQEKVATFRLMLLEKDVNPGGKEETPGQRPSVTETHQLAELNEKKNERLRAAFGISDSYVDGSSFDPQRRAREAKQPAPEPPKPYSLVRESSSSRSPTPKQKKKKKKKDRGRSESSSPRRERKKSSKKKKHRYEVGLCGVIGEVWSPTPKSKRKSKDKKRKRSRSTTPAPKSRRAHRSTSADSASSSDTSRSRNLQFDLVPLRKGAAQGQNHLFPLRSLLSNMAAPHNPMQLSP
ncbi:serine/arginine repetitive matrix 2 [Camelus ferus]|nr:serine/arginine repetitive matrix 2 [Camelus ferus]